MKPIRPWALAPPVRLLPLSGSRLWITVLPLFFVIFLPIFFALLLVLILLAVPAASRGQVPAHPQIPADWKTQQDAIGFSVAVPPGWTAHGDGATGRLEMTAPDGALLVIWPVFLGNARLEAVSAALVANRLSAKLWPNVRWSGVTPISPSAVRLVGHLGDAPFISALAWVQTPKGVAGTFYAATAPPARYPQLSETLSTILSSFRAVGTGSANTSSSPSLPPINYAKWMDPRENAFILEVPQGWRTEGGMFRFASNDTRVGIASASPDNQIRVQIGDANLPTFIEPTPMLLSGGFSEGSWYSPGYGLRMMVRRFLPAPYFLNEYVRSRLPSMCQQPQVDEPRDRPDTVQAINAINARYGQANTGVLTTGGEISFSCESNGQPYRGYYYAATELIRTAGMPGGQWDIHLLAGYLAPAPRADEALSIGAHMLASFQFNPQWQAMQGNILANTSQIVSQTNNEISNMIYSGHERRAAIEDEIARRRSNATLGLEDVVDTNTGEKLKIESGSNYFWMDYRGNIIGTDSFNAPSVDFHELVRLP